MTFFESFKRMTLPFFKRSENGGRHRHEFLDYRENEVAFWQKRECPGDGVYFRGTLRKCAGCSEYRFRAPGLAEVEVMPC